MSSPASVKVIVGSTNPVKVESARQAFAEALFSSVEVIGVNVPSNVPDQPMSDQETLLGARNRSHAARERYPEADFWVGIEGGVAERDGQVESFGWVYVLSPQRHSSARSATFPLPPVVASRLRAGEELGPIVDHLFDEHNSKQKGGAVGLLSRTLVSREALYFQPMVLALIPFMQEKLFR